MIVFFLATPLSFVLCGLLGLLATNRLMRALGVVSVIIAIVNFLLITFMMSLLSFGDGSWPHSVDAGAWIGLSASVLMGFWAIIFLNQQGRLFTITPARARVRLSFDDVMAPVP